MRIEMDRIRGAVDGGVTVCRGAGALLIGVALLLMLIGGVAEAADRKDPGVITLATDLRKGPTLKDPVLATLPAGTKVVVETMAGSQARVRAGKRRGWVSASKVRIGDGAQGSSGSGGGGGGSFFRSMTSLLGGGSGGSGAKVTAGARGLTPGNLEAATPDPAARQRMESLAVSEAAASKFARSQKRVERQIAYLSGAGATASSGGGSSGGGNPVGDLLKGFTSGATSAPQDIGGSDN